MSFPDISKRPWSNIDLMVVGLCDVIAGSISVCTLGFKTSELAMRYLCWRSLKMSERVRANRPPHSVVP